MESNSVITHMKNSCGFFIIDKQQNVLICHPTHASGDQWSIPKGIQEDGETVLEAAIRETWEESSIKLKDDGTFIKLPTIEYKKNKKRLVSFLTRVNKRPPTKCESMVERDGETFPEIDEFMWVSIDEAERLLHQAQASLIKTIKGILKKLDDEE